MLRKNIFCGRIHFPDGNHIAGQPKSNKVIARGKLLAVENARQQIRVSHLDPY